MRYYVTADVHGYFSELKSALAEKGFFEDKEPHKLIICGDIYDRGAEALELQNFILDLIFSAITIRRIIFTLKIGVMQELRRGTVQGG